MSKVIVQGPKEYANRTLILPIVGEQTFTSEATLELELEQANELVNIEGAGYTILVKQEAKPTTGKVKKAAVVEVNENPEQTEEEEVDDEGSSEEEQSSPRTSLYTAEELDPLEDSELDSIIATVKLSKSEKKALNSREAKIGFILKNI